MYVCNYQSILQPLIITSFFTQKHLNYYLKGTTSEKFAEVYGEGNERQLCVGDWSITERLAEVLSLPVFLSYVCRG